MTHTEAPPAPAVVEPAAPPVPVTPPAAVEQPVEAPKQRSTRTPRRGGMPIEPLVIAAGNTATMTATAAYQVAGSAGIIGVAGAAGVASLAAIARRRSTVKTRRAATAAGRPTRRAPAPNRGRTGRGGALGSPSGRGRPAGSGAAAPRGRKGSGRGGAGIGAARTGAPRTGLRSALGSLGGRKNRPGSTGSGAPSKHSRNTGRTRNRPPRVRPALGAAGRGISRTGRGLAAAGRRIRTAGGALGRGATRTTRATARLARTARNKSAPARRAAARQAARIARGVWDGSRAGLVGLAAVLWQRNLRVFAPAVRAMWRRIQSKRAAKRAAAGPTMTGPGVASTPPPVASYVRRPTTVGGSPSNLGARMPGGHHFLAPAMELARIATTYKPDGMMQVGRDFGALPDAFEHIANAMKITTARADAEQPLDPRIIEIMQQIYGLQMKAAELSRQLKPAFQKLHQVDIDRLQNQRTNEREWDVTRNADTSV